MSVSPCSIDIVLCGNSLVDVVSREAIYSYFWLNFCGVHHEMPHFGEKIQPVLRNSHIKHFNCSP